MANQEDRFLSPLAISFDGEEEREPERLPVGFKFRPTDEELIQDFLRPKVLGNGLPCQGIIVDTNIYHHDPTQLAETYADHEKSWYFFTPRNRKYEKGSRPDRAASGGFWKATAADIAIEKKEGDRKIKLGDKTALGFWETKKSRVRSIDRGTKTEWLMYEYKIEESKQPIKNGHMLLDDYVLSKIYRSCRKGWNKAAPVVAVNPDNLQEQIQQPNKRARHQPEPERKPEPNFDPTQIQPEPDNPFLPNPETVQDENAYMFQNQSLQTALWNPNQPPDPLDHNFASSSEDNFFPDLPDFDFPLDFDQHEPANYQPNYPLPQGHNGESSIQPGIANFNAGIHGQDFQQLQNNYGVANFNIGVHGQNSQQLQYTYGHIHSPAQFLASTNSQPAGLLGYNNFDAGYNGMEQCFNRPLFEPGSSSQNNMSTGSSRFDPGFLVACLDQKRF